MGTLEQRLVEYLETITGSAVVLREPPRKAGSRLPLFLRMRYQLRRLRLFDRDCLLALEVSEAETGSPAECAAHAQAMAREFSEPVTLVVPEVASYARNRMVRTGTPFIVPGSQLFMPFMMVDLRERFAGAATKSGEAMTPAAQCLLLYHLLRQPLQGLPLRDIARIGGYSAMMITRVKDEWEANDLCRTARVGRSVVVEFAASGRALWQMAEPLFTSPTRKSQWVHWDRPEPSALEAGFTALSRESLVEDDPIPTWALARDDFRSGIEGGTLRSVEGPEESNARVEEWNYSPTLLSDGPGVDPLSLILSLRDHADDRVQQQLQTVLDKALPH